MNRPDYLSVYEWSQLTAEEQRRELQSLAQEEPAPPVVESGKPSPRKNLGSRKPAPPVVVAPRTIGEAFTLVDGQLMRRRVARVELVQRDGLRFTREVEHLEPCGDRVRFGLKTYRSATIVYYLKTGEIVNRAPRAKPAPRYKAQIRDGRRVVHLGYFASVEERDAAVFAYRLGVSPSGLK